MAGTAERIAIIKLGALGDFVQALGPCLAIRAHHPRAHITLVTTPPYADLATASGYFDAVWTDGRPRSQRGLFALLRRMRKARLDRVYDLQTSTRSSAYFWLLWPQRPEWSGIALGCSHRHTNPSRATMHTVERQAEQLAMAGITDVPATDLSWVEADLSVFDLPARFALLVPGGSAHRPAKRWPAARYGAIAAWLEARGLSPVILGAEAERGALAEIQAICPGARDLVGRTSFTAIIALGRKAAVALGNDTGPMHLLASAGTPSLVLFSHASDPARCAPRGARVEALQVPDLATLTVTAVQQRLSALLSGMADAPSGGPAEVAHSGLGPA